MKTSDLEWLPLPPLLERVKEAVLAELHRRLGERGFDAIRPAHGCIFRFIDEEGSRLTDLAGRAGLTKQAVGQFADELERLGYVERVPYPSDGRAKTIRLTTRGRDARIAAKEIFGEIEAGWAERFGRGRVADLRRLLEEILAAERVTTAL